MNTLTEIVNYVGEVTTPSPEKAQEVIYKIREEVKSYVKTNKLQSLVVGISGGLDSSVIAALCQEKYIGVPLIGISIPMNSSDDHREKAKWVGKNYCTVFEEFSNWDETIDFENKYNMIDKIFDTVSQTDHIAIKAGFDVSKFPISILQGNIKARMRMITLYDMARKCNGIVISTGQRSEDEYMNFFTLHGDVGDISPIFSVGKGFELPIIASSLGIREDIIFQPPSDGLQVTEDNTDEAQLGANYKEVDTIMSIYLNQLPVSIELKDKLKANLFNLRETDVDGFEKVNKIINRHETFKFKSKGPYNFTREQVGLL